MTKLTKDNCCYKMSAKNPPKLYVSPGERFCVETEDCFSGNLRAPKDKFTKAMWPTVNPATGPIFVRDARPGDILRVNIERVKMRSWSAMCIVRGMGALADRVEKVETTILPIHSGRLRVRKNIALPVRPMIGVIGTAPSRGAILNGTPGLHGGNMDCKEIGAGASVYLPVFVEGALLMMGDIHALMGDGEVCLCGAETAGEITLRTSLLRGFLPTPVVETADYLFFVASARTLDDCEKLVLKNAHSYLTQGLKLKANEAARIMSLVGELRICQVVDPRKTMKFIMPKRVLKQLGMPKTTVT